MNKRITKMMLISVVLLCLNACASTFKIFHLSDELTVKTLYTSTSNIHIVETNRKRIMVDTGNVGDAEAIDEKLKDQNIDPKAIDYIIITHSHADHAGNTRYFKDKYGIKIIAGRGDQALLMKGENNQLCPTSCLASLLKSRFQNAKYDPVEADIWVDKELDLNEFGIPGQIKEIPGHTPGSIVLIIKNKAFVGDLIRGGVISKNDPTIHFYMCDLEGNTQDIRNLLKNNEIDEWYTGHFGPLKVEEIRKKFN